MLGILLDDEDDLLYEAGQLVYGESTLQNQKLLLASNKGDFKESPTACVGIGLWLKDNDAEGLPGEIKKEFERDGMTVNSIILSTKGKLDID